ncbi:MAG TPA: hypothetical protein VFP97_04725 [Chitinophagaceae bacterium]|nr:hypothetical protein [Chitinophagaceae bacterium]
MLKYLLTKLIFISWLVLPAQVHVRDEPRHHNVFENEFVRILDVHLGPKDTTGFHLHNTPSVFIVLSNCKVSSQLAGEQPQQGANVSGNISYDPMKTDRLHRVWNEDTAWFHVMDVELISAKQKSTIHVVQHPLLKLLFNEQRVNGYDAELKPGDHLQLPPSASGYLVVSKETTSIDLRINKTIQQRFMKPGHFVWIEPGIGFAIRTRETRPAGFVILQMK